MRRADIVSGATLATEPLVMGPRVREGTHRDLIGGFTPTKREADGDCRRGAALCVDADEALNKSGDWLDAPGDAAHGVADAAAGVWHTKARLTQLRRREDPAQGDTV